MNDRYEEKEPSYGILQISRCSGGSGSFFGSALKYHDSHFEFRLHKARLLHDELGYDRYWPEERILEFKLTPAQFTELITTMNMGQGVPVTLTDLPDSVLSGEYKFVPVPPPPKSSKVEAQRVQQGFEEDVAKLVEKLAAAEKRVAEILEKKTLTKDDKAAIRGAMASVRQFATGHAPHMLTMFSEAAQKVVTQAKQEVDTMVTGFIQRTGLQALREKGLLRLPGGDNE